MIHRLNSIICHCLHHGCVEERTQRISACHRHWKDDETLSHTQTSVYARPDTELWHHIENETSTGARALWMSYPSFN